MSTARYGFEIRRGTREALSVERRREKRDVFRTFENLASLPIFPTGLEDQHDVISTAPKSPIASPPLVPACALQPRRNFKPSGVSHERCTMCTPAVH